MDTRPRSPLVRWLPLLLALIPVGCAMVPVEAPRSLPAANWSLEGKLGVRSDGGSANLQIRWTQTGERYEILLDSLFGRRVARLSSDGTVVTLEVTGEEPVTSSSVEALSDQLLGWRFPVDTILYWLRGQAAPGYPFAAERDERGRLARLTQEGWEIRYEEYAGARPARLRFGAAGVELRLVVREWREGGDS